MYELLGVIDRLDRCEAVDERALKIGVIHISSVAKEKKNKDKINKAKSNNYIILRFLFHTIVFGESDNREKEDLLFVVVRMEMRNVEANEIH